MYLSGLIFVSDAYGLTTHPTYRQILTTSSLMVVQLSATKRPQPATMATLGILARRNYLYATFFQLLIPIGLKL